jgi:beta-galactosidase
MNKRMIIVLLSVLAAVTTVAAASTHRRNFDADWLFTLGDSAQMATRDYDDSSWRHLNLPHDWAIEGDFLASNPSGAGGGALPGGIGWYRKHFRLSDGDRNQQYVIYFDGVYMNSTVYVNGHEVGTRPYGYSSFYYDITPFVNREGDNVVAVKVDNSDQPNSRWYSGCGIYRHVYLAGYGRVRLNDETLQVVMTKKDNRFWDLDVHSAVLNGGKPVSVTVRTTVLSADGRVVATASSRLKAGSGETPCALSMPVERPHLWTLDDPYVYCVKTEVLSGNEIVDSSVLNTGARTFLFDATEGFSLNGVPMKINGVCMHGDLGCLGTAVNEDGLYRQLRSLKQMGCNAIRCSHNPPSPELLNLCDTMGFIVMDESFDMWRRRKTKNDYARFFDKWFERDLSDMVLRDRNHPSILMWSIGNEVLEQWSSADADTLSLEQANLILNAGHDASTLAKTGEMSVNSLLTRRLADIVKSLDTTRPITAGCNEPSPDNHLFKSGAIDIIGFNYHHQWVKDVPKNFPGKPFLFTESVSALQTRGFYMMPSDSVYIAPKEWWMPYSDPSYMCSAYDNMHASWSSTHEETLSVVKHNKFVGGQFIWTGWDYLGEPTPYGFPARSSYFGIVDLAGFPKDVYYLYQSEWTQKPVLHLFPHWNWIEGQTIDLWCYYNDADEVELFINGKSQGIRKKMENVSQPSLKGQATEFHVMWRVTFEPGEVKVVARKNGRDVRQQTIRTAGAPDHIRLTADYAGRNTTFINVEVVDRDGNLCPNADNDIAFSTDGAQIIGVDNGCQTSMERFKAHHRKAFFGKCLVVVNNADKATTLTARCADLKQATIRINPKTK